MYEVRKQARNVAGTSVTTWRRELRGASTFDIEVGCGGHYTYLRLRNMDAACMEAAAIHGENDRPCGIKLILSGTSDRAMLHDALRFAIDVLREAMEAEHEPAT